MQTLYTLATSESDAVKGTRPGFALLDEKIAHSIDLFTICILYTFKVAQYAETASRNRAAKYLTTSSDLNVSTKIVDNEFMKQTYANESFVEKIKEPRINHFIDEEWVKKIYLLVEKTPEYIDYISTDARDAKSEKAIMQFIWEKHIHGNEGLMEHFTDEFADWEDDKEMTIVLMENFFKNQSKINFLVPVSGEKKEYAHSLLNTVQEKAAYCMELIEPKLMNWDFERVALIDLILLRMGICEMLYFPTIPTKVTINEYIEIAKVYSTLQSGQFVNGVLDNILKELEKEDKITKEERSRKS